MSWWMTSNSASERKSKETAEESRLFYSGHKKVGCEPVVLPGPPTSFLQKDDWERRHCNMLVIALDQNTHNRQVRGEENNPLSS